MSRQTLLDQPDRAIRQTGDGLLNLGPEPGVVRHGLVGPVLACGGGGPAVAASAGVMA
jgi:hypothetical protein